MWFPSEILIRGKKPKWAPLFPYFFLLKHSSPLFTNMATLPPYPAMHSLLDQSYIILQTTLLSNSQQLNILHQNLQLKYNFDKKNYQESIPTNIVPPQHKHALSWSLWCQRFSHLSEGPFSSKQEKFWMSRQ